jgi:hypothetical protein
MEGQKIADLGKIALQAMGDPFWALRGQAIQSYAAIEQALCSLFSSFAGLNSAIAGSIYFRIQVPGASDKILRDLLTKKYGDAYTIFWNSLAELIRETTATRNKVVHWNVANFIDNGGLTMVGLVPPNIYESFGPKAAVPIGSAEIAEFMRRCDFISRMCGVFHLFLTFPTALDQQPEVKQTWNDIFAQRVVYPPPKLHPLFPTSPIPQVPHPPFAALLTPPPAEPTQSDS